MAHFSNGTEGQMYQEKYCYRCAYWNDDAGCPVWFLHELHVGEPRWRRTLDQLIPMVPKTFNGVEMTFPGECYTFLKRGKAVPAKRPLTPGQQKGLDEWRARRPAATPRRDRGVEVSYL